MTDENWRDALTHEPHFCISETPAHVAWEIVAPVANSTGRCQYAGQVLSCAESPRIYSVTDIDKRNRISCDIRSRCRTRTCPQQKSAIAG